MKKWRDKGGQKKQQLKPNPGSSDAPGNRNTSLNRTEEENDRRRFVRGAEGVLEEKEDDEMSVCGLFGVAGVHESCDTRSDVNVLLCASENVS
ncbi:hypothetical protein Baya_15007 [Bagarius yarrelli]|uniref:Uncharacterized protein n=1 Tax=Bagarius yarrelli TaxID=175774 RepID=A0A556VAK9_BAGYA|nr:hypothetical protein Baya_15007 [Bagarius yarrelli]